MTINPELLEKSENEVHMYGRIVRRPSFREFVNGVAQLTFLLETPKERVDRATGEKKILTPWHRVVVWGKKAEDNRWLLPGDCVAIKGELQSSNDPATKGQSEIHAFRVVADADAQVEGDGNV